MSLQTDQRDRKPLAKRLPSSVPAPAVEKALAGVKPAKAGFLEGLFGSFIHHTVPPVEPLEQQERHVAIPRKSLPEPGVARDRQLRADELKKVAELEALKARLRKLEVDERLSKPPERAVELSVPLKASAQPSKEPVNRGQQAKPVELLPVLERFVQPARLPTTPEAARKEELKLKQKAEDTEAELVLKELTGAAEEQEAAAGESGAPVHRRYLLRRRTEGPQPEGAVRVRAPESAVEQSEFAGMLSDVYSQLDSSKSEKITDELGVKAPPKAAAAEPGAAAPKAGEKPAGGSLEEMLGLKAFAPVEEKAAEPSGEGPSTSLFAQLSATSGTAKAEAKSKPQVALVDVEAKKGMGCPTCHSTNAKIVFCPYCASGMCANCSPKIVPKGDTIVYTCPKCGEEVSVKKKIA